MTVRERPMLFNGAMVRAILSGAKTQTRRAIKPQPFEASFLDAPEQYRPSLDETGLLRVATPLGVRLLTSPFGQPGDRLWVRESFADLRGTGIEHRPDPAGPIQRYAYSADTLAGSDGDHARKAYGIKWRPSIHMPRWACRLVLEITEVRVERLQAISQADAIAEGLTQADSGSWLPGPYDYPEWAFHQLWDQVYGESAWDSNPWVWVVGFRPLEADRHHAASDTKKETRDGRS